jgi:4'-phosphopantetheinyl transferase
VRLEPDEVHVRYRTLDVVGTDEYERAWAVLSPDERTRASRFVFPVDRERYVISHALVRRMLSRYGALSPADWPFVTNAFGKPAIAPDAPAADLRFNLSHTRGLIACAVSHRTVGLDVELIDDRVDGLEIASRFFCPMELDWLRAHAPEQQAARFIELWTLKESFVKGIGTGLACPLNSFGFAFPAAGAIRFQPPAETPDAWHFTLHSPTSRHRLAVAVMLDDAQGTPRIAIIDDSEG